MKKYWDRSIEYNPCLYCPDRRCDCSTHEEGAMEKCISCSNKECKTQKCDKYYKAIEKYKGANLNVKV